MTPNKDNPSPAEAQEALASVDALTLRARQRSAYSRAFAAAMSLWSGVLVATMGTGIWPLLFVGGLVAYIVWRKRTETWPREVESKRGLGIVLGLGALVGAAFIGAYIARVYMGQFWLPLLLGVVVAVLLFALSEKTYRALRTTTPAA